MLDRGLIPTIRSTADNAGPPETVEAEGLRSGAAQHSSLKRERECGPDRSRPAKPELHIRAWARKVSAQCPADSVRLRVPSIGRVFAHQGSKIPSLSVCVSSSLLKPQSDSLHPESWPQQPAKRNNTMRATTRPSTWLAGFECLYGSWTFTVSLLISSTRQKPRQLAKNTAYTSQSSLRMTLQRSDSWTPSSPRLPTTGSGLSLA